MASPQKLENGDKTQIIPEESTMDDKTSKFLLLGVVIACLISVIALVLGIVGVASNGTNTYYVNGGSSSGGSSSTGSLSGGGSGGDDKIWMLQIGHFGGNTQYLDESTGTIRGYDVDVANAVCQIANKNCRIVWDLYERCWDSQVGQRPRGGMGLMGGWYDGCIGWYNTLDRARTFTFSKPLERGYPIAFYQRRGGNFNWPDFSGLKIGFMDGWWIDEHCLERYNPRGYNKDDTTQVIHYPDEDAVAMALESGEIQIAFVPVLSTILKYTDVVKVYTPEEDKCANGGPSLMMPRNQDALLSWWNAAFDQLITTSQYTEICNNIRQEHGGQPGEDPANICIGY